MQHRCRPYCHRELPEITSHIIVTFAPLILRYEPDLGNEEIFKIFSCHALLSSLVSTWWKPFRAHYIAKLRVIKALEWDDGRHGRVVSPQDQPGQDWQRWLLLTWPVQGSLHTLQHQPTKCHKRIFRCWVKKPPIEKLIKYHDEPSEHDNKEHCDLKMPVHSWSFKM